MSKPPEPPDVGIFSLSPNPPDPDDRRRRSRKEEERRQRAIKAHMKRAVSKLPEGLVDLVKFNELSGEIAPDAQSSSLAKKVQEQTTPKLVEFTSHQAGSVKIGEMRLPDGTVIKNVEALGPSMRRMTISFQELATLLQKGADIVGEIKGWVVGICVKVIAAGWVLIGRGDEKQKSTVELIKNDDDDAALPEDFSQWKEEGNH